MFNQQEYINEYIKSNYKSIKLRVRRDNKVLMKRLSDVDNINQYISELIMKDVYANRKYNYINDEIKIDFELSKTMQDLINRAEEADYLDDYGLYMNIADAIDSQGKNETTHHVIRETEWKLLTRRYCL